MNKRGGALLRVEVSSYISNKVTAACTHSTKDAFKRIF